MNENNDNDSANTRAKNAGRRTRPVRFGLVPGALVAVAVAVAAFFGLKYVREQTPLAPHHALPKADPFAGVPTLASLAAHPGKSLSEMFAAGQFPRKPDPSGIGNVRVKSVGEYVPGSDFVTRYLQTHPQYGLEPWGASPSAAASGDICRNYYFAAPGPEGIIAADESDLANTSPDAANSLASRQLPAWKWNLRADSNTLRDYDDGNVTLTPVLLSVSRTLGKNGGTFQPFLSAGVGVLGRSREDADMGRIEREILPIWQTGVGLQWTPAENVIFRLNYDYRHSPVNSTLAPEIPSGGHSLKLGIELNF